MRRQNLIVIIGFLLIGIVIFWLVVSFSSSQTFITPTATPNPDNRRVPDYPMTMTAAAVQFGATPCVVSRGREDLPDLTTLILSMMSAAEIAGVTGSTRVSGENCLNDDDSVRYFVPTSTDFYLAAEVSNLDDYDALMALVLDIVDVILVQSVHFPAPAGDFDLLFTRGTEQRNLRTTFDEIATARAEGLTGAALVDVLGGMR